MEGKNIVKKAAIGAALIVANVQNTRQQEWTECIRNKKW